MKKAIELLEAEIKRKESREYLFFLYENIKDADTAKISQKTELLALYEFKLKLIENS